MGKSGHGFIAGVYRPQVPKRRRHSMIAKNNVVMVDKVREMAKNCRREKTIKRNSPRPVQQSSLSKVETFQFNKGRPLIDKQERKRVKRNLFGKEEENDRRSSVIRKLGAELKVKKKLFGIKTAPPHAARSSKYVDVQQSVLSKRLLLRHHPQDQVTSSPCQIPYPMKLSPNFFSMEENPTSFPARVHLPQIPVSGPSWDENPLDHFSSAARHTIWEGSTTCESFTDKGHCLFQENCSPKSIANATNISPVTYKFGRYSSNVSFSSNFSFQETNLSRLSYSNIDNDSIPSTNFPTSSFHDNNLFSLSYSSINDGSIPRTKFSTSPFDENNLFSHNYSNIDNGFISSTNFPTSSSFTSESWIARKWMPEDECIHGSPASNVARVMGRKGGRVW